MRIGILSKGPKLYSTRRLKEAAQKRGHKCRVINPLHFAIYVEEQNPELTYKQEKVPRLDAIIPRIAANDTTFGLAVVRQFEQIGVYSLNHSNGISLSRDKLRTLQVLSRRNIGIPASAFIYQQPDILTAINKLGGAPIIVKLLEGSQGIGVMLAESEKSAEAIVETLHVARQEVLIQKFVSESKGIDIRAFVVGDKVVASMRRIADKSSSEFRSNVHRGGKTEKIILESAYEAAAVRAAQILGLRVAGVDILESNDGPQIMEVNSSPGLEGIEGATGVDVADSIIDYLEEQVEFPDLDLREKLTVSKGFKVVEITISKNSELANQTLETASLKEKGIQILTVLRNGLTIPTPTDFFVIHPGDTLLCFGKTLALKALMPKKRGTR
ncbi:MAG: RimK family alpha-L-glutamate ligase [bacterium]|nr:RimK family alpha-L-glutamate ligase [bacterium]